MNATEPGCPSSRFGDLGSRLSQSSNPLRNLRDRCVRCVRPCSGCQAAPGPASGNLPFRTSATLRPPLHPWRTLAFFALVAFVFSPAVPAQTPTATTLAKAVDTHYNHLTSLQTRFSERYRGMGLDRTESGTLTLRKPGRMRWAYDAPAGKLFLLNGKDAISYTPGDPQANRLPAKQLDDLRSPLRFLLGHTELAKELDHLTAAPVENGLYSLAGSPHNTNGTPAQRIRQVTLVVDTKGLIHSLQIDESRRSHHQLHVHRPA